MAAGIAHDFNNLLTVITGNAQLLEMREDISDDVREHLRSIYEQGHRAVQLVRQILDFSRDTDVECQPVDLVPFTKEATKLLARTFPENIQIVTEFDAEAFVVNADQSQLQQVLTNLAINAVHAMPEGGKLIIGLSRAHLGPNEQTLLPGMGAGEWVVWTVSDTGTGMSPEVLARIYEPFFTTKAPGKGTGLGLAQVYGLVGKHDGFIDVKSEVGKGTTFTVYLRKVEEVSAVLPDGNIQTPEGGNETILVVEDNAAVRDTLKAMLRQLNYRVLTACNGQEALDVHTLHADEIALVLTDVSMPVMGGLELFEILAKKDPGIRVVAMSGYVPEKDEKVHWLQRLAGFLEKPPVIEKVAEVVREALRERGTENGHQPIPQTV